MADNKRTLVVAIVGFLMMVSPSRGTCTVGAKAEIRQQLESFQDIFNNGGFRPASTIAFNFFDTNAVFWQHNPDGNSDVSFTNEEIVTPLGDMIDLYTIEFDIDANFTDIKTQNCDYLIYKGNFSLTPRPSKSAVPKIGSTVGSNVIFHFLGIVDYDTGEPLYQIVFFEFLLQELPSNTTTAVPTTTTTTTTTHSSVTETCQPVGGHCNSNANCCAGSGCTSNDGQCCSFANQTCVHDTDCCTFGLQPVFPDRPTCVANECLSSCLLFSEPCSASVPCCSNFCDNGLCGLVVFPPK